jgi:type II secretory pathway predicted ATPase ExeA
MTEEQKAALPRPLKLRVLLARLRIRDEDIAATIVQADGKRLSRSAFSQWVNGTRLLVNTPVAALEAQVADFLRAEHVSEKDIATAFERNEDNRIFHVTHSPAPVIHHDPEIKPVETAVLHQKTKIHFGLTANPFMDDVLGQSDVYLNEDSRYVSGAMMNWVRVAGLGVVVGESGAGKSVLRRKFIAEIRAKHADIRIIETKSFDKSKMHAAALCEAIINDLAPGMQVKNSLEARARQVEKVLGDSFENNCRHVMLIEEAHDLPIATLKYLKRFWEMEVDFVRMLAIIMIAQPEMKMKLDERHHPELREFIRRCEVAELMPLDGKVADYLKFKFARCGSDAAKVLSADAYDAIVERLTVSTGKGKRSMVYPLVVNNLVTRAMNEAATAGEKLVSGDVIRGI